MKIIYSDLFPAELENDTLYVSHEYNTTSHLCASGCGFRVVLPLGKGGWKLLDDNRLSLSPSVHVPSCNSHYFIEDGGIRWAKYMSDQMAEAYSRADQKSYNQLLQQNLFEKLLRKLMNLLFWQN